MGLPGMSKALTRLSVVLFFAAGTGACSTIPDWVDPTTWGSDTPASTTDSQLPADNTQTSDNAQFPDLSKMPDKPQRASTPDEQKQVAQTLTSDRDQTNYSADALRGGTEAAAPPPPDTPPPPVESVEQSTQTASTDTASTDDSDTTQPAPQPVAQQPAAAPTQPVAVASTTPVPGSMPAVPADAPRMPVNAALQPAVGGTVDPSDAALGFRASTAPPLDASVAQFVAPSVLDRYRQTAKLAQASGIAPGSYSAVASNEPAVPLRAPAGTRPAVLGTGVTDVGGPEVMTGDVVANFNSISSSPAVPVSVSPVATPGDPVAVVYFPHDTTVLDTDGKAQVKAVLAAFQARGGQGFVRVVGHSSSRTANMSVERHIALNFERSQARANSVARALIAAGIPASKVLVEAVGDTQPIYYESMPQGEEGNRRAEIFLQG